jgi:hypothetical protein
MNWVRMPRLVEKRMFSKRRLLLRRGQQDEAPVRPVGVEIEVIAELIPDLGRVARQVDVEIARAPFPCPVRCLSARL